VQSYTVKSARHSPFGERDEIEIFGCSSATIVATIVGREAGVSLKNIVGDCAGVFSASVAVGAAKVAVAVGAWVAQAILEKIEREKNQVCVQECQN